MFGSDGDDTRNLVHVSLPPSEHSRFKDNMKEAADRGLFEGYEFVITGPEVDMVDVDALAEELADRLADELEGDG